MKGINFSIDSLLSASMWLRGMHDMVMRVRVQSSMLSRTTGSVRRSEASIVSRFIDTNLEMHLDYRFSFIRQP